MNTDDIELEKAWLLWEKLNQSAQELWDEYEDEFVARCQQDMEPAQPDNEINYDDTDIPF